MLGTACPLVCGWEGEGACCGKSEEGVNLVTVVVFVGMIRSRFKG